MMKPIQGFPNYYVDKQGNVYSNKLYRNKNNLRKLNPHDHNGYLRVNLYRNGKIYPKLVHRLVLETFVGLCPEGCWARHKDSNRKNNYLDNLEWDTPKNNIADKVKNGTANIGENHSRSKLTEKQVKEIRELYTSGKFLQKDLAKIYGVNPDNISIIVNYKRWTHI